MNRFSALAPLLYLFAMGCASTPAPRPAATPAPTLAPTEDPEPSRDPARVAVLVEEGRAIQRENGEDGAPAALAFYDAALAADPLCQAALWERGWSLQRLERWDEAVTAWDALRTLNPSYPELERHYPVLRMRRDAAAALAALPEAGELPPPEEEPRDGPRLRLNAVGDIQMGKAWPEDRAALPANNGRVLFEHVADLLRDADVTFGNLETVLADEGESAKCGKRSKVCYAFRAPTASTEALLDAGFDLLSIANNHTGDFGEEGRLATMQALDAAGLRHSGPVGDVASLEVNGLRVAMVAFSTGAGLYRVQDIDTARKVVADVDRTHDLVIVSFHGGAEGSKAVHVPKAEEMFYGENRGDVYAFAHAMVDVGADVVLGHGPHVLRAMEIYRGRFIAYSLGNFCAWTGFNLSGPLGISAVLQLTLATNGVVTQARLVPLRIEQPGVPEPDPAGGAIEAVRRLSQEDLGASPLDTKGEYTRVLELSSRRP